MSAHGTYTFKWEHPASEVWVTGTFDDWNKTVKLEKKGEHFEETVPLPTDKKVLYKFVVDGAWILDHTKPSESDEHGIANNVLQTSDIKPAPVAAHTISSIAPQSTTAAMVGELPKETPNAAPGAFIETPATEKAEEFGVKPIAGTSDIGNPISLAPGEKIPESVTSKGIDSNVTHDEASYNKPDAGPASDALKNDESAAPVRGGTIIPESSLPIGAGAVASPFVNSAGEGSTTAALVGNLPKENTSSVPEVVKESQQAAHASPEASANPEAVSEKKDLESELKAKVPEEPAAAESGTSATGLLTGAAVAVGSAAAVAGGAAVAAKDRAAEATAPALASAQETAQPYVSSAQETAKPVTDKVADVAASAGVISSGTVASDKNIGSAPETAAAGVPAVVSESLEKAHKSPEAAANPEAVAEKKDLEAELAQKVQTVNSAGEPAPTASAAAATTVPGESSKAAAVDSKPLDTKPTDTKIADPTPLADAPKVTGESAAAAAVPATTADTTKPTTADTTTAAATSAAATPSTPSKDATTKPAETSSPATDKKSKRRSIFGRIKSIIKHDKDDKKAAK